MHYLILTVRLVFAPQDEWFMIEARYEVDVVEDHSLETQNKMVGIASH